MPTSSSAAANKSIAVGDRYWAVRAAIPGPHSAPSEPPSATSPNTRRASASANRSASADHRSDVANRLKAEIQMKKPAAAHTSGNHDGAASSSAKKPTSTRAQLR